MPYVRKDGKLQPATWEEALRAAAEKLKSTSGDKIAAIAGDMACMESMFALKELMISLRSPHLDCRQDGAKLDASDRASYLFNTGIAGIEQADVIVLVGTNPRVEASLVNARIRKAYLKGKLKIYGIGEPADLTYKVEWLGNNPALLADLALGKHPLAAALGKAERPMIIIGQGALARPDGAAILSAARAVADMNGFIKEGWNGFNVLHRAAARVGGLDLGFVPQKSGKDIKAILESTRKWEIGAVYLLGADEIDTSQLGNAFVIYQGHHGDAGAHRADIILPGAAYTEKNATYVNTEGRMQYTAQAVTPVGEAKEDWKIIRALSEVIGKKLPYDTLEQLRAKMPEPKTAMWQAGKGDAGTKITAEPFTYPVKNFYMTDPISRASKTMAECVSVITQGKEAA
jgi:NADH-quinone oxidoreductase subunit G